MWALTRLHRPLQHTDVSTCSQDHAGCRRAELLEEAKKKIGSTPLEEAILQYPVETWRVWSSIHPRKYTEDSEVCSTLPAEHEGDEMWSLQHQTPVQPYVMLACRRIMLWLMRGRGRPPCPTLSQHTDLMRTLV